ncbi:MAG: HAD-IA family hydrolase [Candidatus Omnitrophica bacterium]|nr:HAD-IA family hydrolase [Candidatus Omnitrophota bacterium]
MSAMMETFEAVCFDAGGTLLAPYPSVGEIYSRVAAVYGCQVSPEAVETQFHQAWVRADGLSNLVSHSSEKIEKEFWKSLVAEVFAPFEGPRDFEGFFEELYERFARPECWRLFPETREVLKTLKSRGKRLCVISNWDSRLLTLCEGLGLMEYFDFILISAVFGASKPSRRIFDEAVRRFGVDPAGAVHVGDSLEDDVRGARGAGLEAVFLDRKKRSHQNPEAFRETRVIHDLRGLLGP